MRKLLWGGVIVAMAAVAVAYCVNRRQGSVDGRTAADGGRPCCGGAEVCVARDATRTEGKPTEDGQTLPEPLTQIPSPNDPEPAVTPVRTLGKIIIQSLDEAPESTAPVVPGQSVIGEEAAEVPPTMPRVGDDGGVPAVMPRVEDGPLSVSEWPDRSIENSPPCCPEKGGYCPYSGKCVPDCPARMPRVEEEQEVEPIPSPPAKQPEAKPMKHTSMKVPFRTGGPGQGAVDTMEFRPSDAGWYDFGPVPF